jgi:diaminopimelate decarboxylase
MHPQLFDSDRCAIGPTGELIFDGVELGQLARGLETPFFLVSERILEDNYHRLVTGFSSVADFGVYYSVKTNFETEVLRTWRRLGAGVEIAGELDLHVALRADFAPATIVFDGPCKSDRELRLAAEHRIRSINVESVDEIRRVDAVGKALGRPIDIGVRIATETRAPYYDNLITTYKQKFGFPIATCRDAFAAIRESRHVRLLGINTHIGSQLLAPALFVEALSAMFRLAADLGRDGFAVSEINIGGGFPAQSMRNLRLSRRMRGARILERFNMLEKRTPPIEEFGRAIAQAYQANRQTHGIAPRLTAEPGRSLVNNACVLVGQVRLVKANWVFTDISINDLPENLFFTERRLFFPEKMREAPVAKANVSGPTLATNDIMFFEKEIPRLAVGDPVVVFDAGGYSIPRANQFTRPRNPVLFLAKDGGLRSIRRRETVEDVIRMQRWDGVEEPEMAARPWDHAGIAGGEDGAEPVPSLRSGA